MEESFKHFKELFVWNGDKIEDVKFWCEPDLTKQALQNIRDLRHLEFDGFASFEARGYLLAGAASVLFGLPVTLIRKHKKFYEKMAHSKISFTNWKNENETLTLLKDSIPKSKRILIVDDIIDTGRSLQAGTQIFEENGISVVGAFYLMDARSESEPIDFSFPIFSLLKHKLF